MALASHNRLARQSVAVAVQQRAPAPIRQSPARRRTGPVRCNSAGAGRTRHCRAARPAGVTGSAPGRHRPDGVTAPAPFAGGPAQPDEKRRWRFSSPEGYEAYGRMAVWSPNRTLTQPSCCAPACTILLRASVPSTRPDVDGLSRRLRLLAVT